MGIDLFDVDIAAIVADAIGPGLPEVTLIKVTNAARTAGNLAGGTNPTTTSYACRGLTIDLEERFIDGDTVRRGDRAVMLIGDTINGGATVPAAGDRITVEGVTWAVVAIVDSDPARATWTVALRGA